MIIGWQRVSEQECQDELMNDEEKVLAGRSDTNFPALLTKDCRVDDANRF